MAVSGSLFHEHTAGGGAEGLCLPRRRGVSIAVGEKNVGGERLVHYFVHCLEVMLSGSG